MLDDTEVVGWVLDCAFGDLSSFTCHLSFGQCLLLKNDLETVTRNILKTHSLLWRTALFI